MAVFDFPDGVYPSKIEWGLVDYTVFKISPFTRSQQIYAAPGSRWKATLYFDDISEDGFVKLKSLVAKLRGKSNFVRVADYALRQPRGVASGTPSVAPKSNLLPYSEDFSQWSASNGATVASASVVAPDGEASAFTLTCDGTLDPQLSYTTPISGLSYQTYTFSIWAWTDAGQPTDYALYLYADSPFYDDGDLVRLITLTTTPTRYSFTKTLPSVGTSLALTTRLDPPDNAAASSYCYVYGGQLTNTAGAVPYLKTSGSAISSTPVVGGRIPVTGWTSDTAGILLAGDWISVGNELKMVVEDAESDSSGYCELLVEPPFRNSPTATSIIQTQTPTALMQLDTNTPSWNFTSEFERSMTLSLVEVY